MAETSFLNLKITNDNTQTVLVWRTSINGDNLPGSESNAQLIDAGIEANSFKVKSYADLASFPATGIIDRIYIALDTGIGYRWDDVGLTYVVLAGSGGSITTSDTAPVDPDVGDLWFDSTTGKLKIYYDDGNSIQWVDTTPIYLFEVAMQDTAPSNPGAGDLWWDSTNGVLMIYYNDGDSAQWVDATPQYLYVLPQATETVLGGVKAKSKTTESLEVAIDDATGKLYARENIKTGATVPDVADGTDGDMFIVVV